MRHVNIPIFIPHLGCPNQCVFCNQRSISGVDKFDPSSVRDIIDAALKTVSKDDDVEIAFFGGSFTGIDRELMLELLSIGKSYIDKGVVNALRCSTRPDYIDEEIIDILKRYGMKTVELGLQSSSDKVLEFAKRGHYFKAEEKACELIVNSGINLVGQMMIGLPGADVESELGTARFIINAGARAARIYPTVVFHDTELCKMMEHGVYEPISIDAAVSRSANVFSLFVENGVDVLRIGLHSSERLASEETYAAGPNHPALGELVIGEYYYKKIRDNLYLSQISENERIDILVSRGSLSKAIGQNGKNKNRLRDEFPNINFTESDDISGYEISVITRNGEIKCT